MSQAAKSDGQTVEIFGTEKKVADLIVMGLGLVAVGAFGLYALPYVVAFAWDMVHLGEAAAILAVAGFLVTDPGIRKVVKTGYYALIRNAFRKVIGFNFRAYGDLVIEEINAKIARVEVLMNTLRGTALQIQEGLNEDKRVYGEALLKLQVAEDLISQGGDAADDGRAQAIVQGEVVTLRLDSINSRTEFLEELKSGERVLLKALSASKVKRDVMAERIRHKLDQYALAKTAGAALREVNSLIRDPQMMRDAEEFFSVIGEEMSTDLGALNSIVSGTDTLEGELDIGNEVSIRKALAHLRETEKGLDVVGDSNARVEAAGGSSAVDRALRKQAADAAAAKVAGAVKKTI